MLDYKNFEGDIVTLERVKKAVQLLLNDWLEDDRCTYTSQLHEKAYEQVLFVGCIKRPVHDLDELSWWQAEQILDILYDED